MSVRGEVGMHLIDHGPEGEQESQGQFVTTRCGSVRIT